MSYRLLINDQLLLEGDLKSLTALFNDLSGLNFAKTKRSSWLDKMSSGESYATYLKIKATEFKLTDWHGELSLVSPDQTAIRVHFFETHRKILDDHTGNEAKDTG
ncbi:MAG: hypothetical protein C9356_08420 [Oleiphilus sp.]|nr:MAG: hypothetical protein C9356_08420 [Oleiphilus sp.]